MKKVLALTLCLVMLACFAGVSTGCKKQQELNILNWGEYIDPELITRFEEETGIKVNYVEMTSNEEMLIKLRSADCVYDLCFPSDYIIQQLIAQDLLMELDMSKIPNAKNIDPRILEVTNTFDPGAKYSLPYMWGTVGILYNTSMVDEEVTSWDILWDEKYSGQIWQYDSVRDAFAVALLKLGYDINSTNEAEVTAAKEELIRQIPLLKGCGTDNIRDSMINNKAALAVTYSGDALACMDQNPDLAFAVPDEGSNVWFDNVVIPKTARNTDAALAFINFINDAENAKQNTEYIYYSTPNKAALDLLSEDYTEDETFNPPQEVLDRCSIYRDLGVFVDFYNAAWKEFKTKMGE